MKIQMIGFPLETVERISCLLTESIDAYPELRSNIFEQFKEDSIDADKADIIIIGYHDVTSALKFMRFASLEHAPLFIFAGMSYHFETAGPFPANAKVIHLDLYADYDKLIHIVRQKQSRMEASYPAGINQTS